MYIITFIIILAVLVFVHELGHFIFAKLAGIRVDEFAIGFPPRIVSFTRGETRYALNLIPFGGYVKIFGEDNEGAAVDPALPAVTDKRSFANKPKSIQALVLAAGIIFNIIFAWLLISLGFMIGMPVPQGYTSSAVIQNPVTTIVGIEPGSPAALADLKPGDVIDSLKSGTQTLNKPSISDLQAFMASHNNVPVDITISRGQEIKTLSVTPTIRTGDKATIGISPDEIGVLKLSFFKAFYEGVKLTGFLVWNTATGLIAFIGSAFTGHAHIADVTGPVGIVGIVKDYSQLGFVYILSFTALISINLAIINLIPFPALDGGRIFFVLIEKIKGKPLNQNIVQIINTTGLALLLLLMVVVTFHDIRVLIK